MSHSNHLLVRRFPLRKTKPPATINRGFSPQELKVGSIGISDVSKTQKAIFLHPKTTALRSVVVEDALRIPISLRRFMKIAESVSAVEYGRCWLGPAVVRASEQFFPAIYFPYFVLCL